MSEKARMSIQYMDGTEQVFEWTPDPAQQQNVTSLASNLHKTLQEDYLLLDMGDKLRIIPRHNIKSIELDRVPAKLPANAIRGVQLVE